ncbi:Palmitoyltransferase akr1 [Cytospora mali]|uniref:Palmitoyltransferase akr1 n=1 Tax=Cytospora mali TaxID=578113 RepID=A0A194VKX5_CYTMA|nr:Palmitoyltransferase akr1 [Valsa mali]
MTSPSSTDTWMSSGSSALEHEASVLAMAILTGNTTEVQSLVNVGVTISERHHWTLYQACLQGVDMVGALLASPDINFNIDIPNDGGDPILHYVLRTPGSRFEGGKTSVVRLLLAHGADPFKHDRFGETALHILAGNTEEEIELVSGNVLPPPLDDQNHYGDTALIVAVISRNLAAARVLLEAGANPNLKGEQNSTAAQYAERQGCLDMMCLLVGFGAELDDDMDM